MSKETAEQKLLNIIEETEAKESSEKPEGASAGDGDGDVAVQVAASVKGAGLNVNFSPIIDQVMSLIKGGSSGEKSAPFGLKDINRILAVGIVVITVLLILDFVNGMKFSKREVNITAKENIVDQKETILPIIKEVEEYVKVFARRNIFQPYEPSEEVVSKNVPAEKRLIQERVKNLKLVGVSWLDTTESASALIENTENGMTYFLKVGEKVNSVELKKIYAESVVLTFSGEDLELNL